MRKPFKPITFSILASLALCNNANAISDALKVKIVNGSTSDETIIRFTPGATTGFDGSYDAYKMFSSSLVVPSVFTRIDSVTPLSINALPPLSQATNIDLYTQIKVAGIYTLNSIEMGTGFPAAALITLQDMQTGSSYNFRNGQSISMTLPVNTSMSASRFTITFTPPAPLNFTAIEPTCHGLTDGSITATKPGNTNWDYELRDQNYILVSSGTGINETTQITGLAGGTYILYTGTTGIYTDSTEIMIAEPLPVLAMFTSDHDTVQLSSSGVYFTNNSSNAGYYTWDFGDGVSVTNISPFHNYTSAGIFTVSLIASDSNGCTSLASGNITVNQDLSTSISENISTGHLLVTQCGNTVHINIHNTVKAPIMLMTYNQLGQMIYSHAENTAELSADVELQTSGSYIIRSIVNGKPQSKTISFIK